DFLNKDAYLKISNTPPRESLTMFEVDVTDNADANGGEPIFLADGTPVGRVTSGAYGYTVGKSLAIGYAREGVVRAGDRVEIFILGKPHAATVLDKPPFDAGGERLRA
ncbi:MAG: glycine cleavage T C-terminal barrel domain-containing protein, partial [Pseudomonadota bacterium]|nr:glycine cleavage T C-terminal barrel domain-containing protein [Pseudomonadota bacterium]